MSPGGRRTVGALHVVEAALVDLVPAEVRHVSLLLTEEAPERQAGEPSLLDCLSYYRRGRVLAFLHRPGRDLDAGLERVRVPKDQEVIAARDVGEHLALDRGQTSLVPQVTFQADGATGCVSTRNRTEAQPAPEGKGGTILSEDAQPQNPPVSIRPKVLGQAPVRLATQALSLLDTVDDEQAQPGEPVVGVLFEKVGRAYGFAGIFAVDAEEEAAGSLLDLFPIAQKRCQIVVGQIAPAEELRVRQVNRQESGKVGLRRFPQVQMCTLQLEHSGFLPSPAYHQPFPRTWRTRRSCQSDILLIQGREGRYFRTRFAAMPSRNYSAIASSSRFSSMSRGSSW